VRAGLLLLLILALARAQEPPDAERIEELVERLASPEYVVRLDARLRLIALGESIHPRLDEIADQTRHPDIRWTLRQITKSSRTLRLVAIDAPDRLVLGSDLVVDVSLENRSELTYVLTFGNQGAHDSAAFRLRAGTNPAEIPMRFLPATPASITIEPGKSHALELRVVGTALPGAGSGPVPHRIALEVDALRAEPGPDEKRDWSSVRLELETREFEIVWIARPIAELERLLDSKDEAERDSAIRELHVRDGVEVRNLLRRRVEDPDLKLATVRRLGAAGLERDFPLIRKAADDPEIRIKLAALEALGNFRLAAARTQLILHVDDVGVRTTAIRALTRHKHHATVECFIRLLKNNLGGGAWVAVVQDTLEEWTGLRVPNRYSEVVAFEKWWIENRSRWIQEQVIGK
jgi:hypothetical protein